MILKFAGAPQPGQWISVSFVIPLCCSSSFRKCIETMEESPTKCQKSYPVVSVSLIQIQNIIVRDLVVQHLSGRPLVQRLKITCKLRQNDQDAHDDSGEQGAPPFRFCMHVFTPLPPSGAVDIRDFGHSVMPLLFPLVRLSPWFLHRGQRQGFWRQRP